MKVIVYDLVQIVASKLGNKYPGQQEKNAVIVGDRKVILTDVDGIHTIHPINSSIMLSNPLGIESVKIKIKDLVEKNISVPVDEVELGTFIRTFGARIENNYSLLLNSIKEIGLNPDDYPRKIKKTKAK